MMFDLTIRDGSHYTIDEATANALKDMRNDPKNATQTFEVNDDQYLIRDIKYIKKSNRAGVPTPSNRQLGAGNRCRGKKSIQLEIMKLIRKKYPKDWPKYFRDREYKEKLRLWLHEKQGDDWCDSVAGTCVCTADYTPDPKVISSALSMFPGAEPVERKDLA